MPFLWGGPLSFCSLPLDDQLMCIVSDAIEGGGSYDRIAKERHPFVHITVTVISVEALPYLSMTTSQTNTLPYEGSLSREKAHPVKSK